MKSFVGKLAVITGGSQGIGRAIAILLAKQECQIILLARDQSGLERVASTITQFGGVVTPIAVSYTHLTLPTICSV